MIIKKTGDKWKVDIWPNGREGKHVQRSFWQALSFLDT